MSRIVIEKGVCSACNKVSEFRVVQSINVPLNPELREQLIRGEINAATCSHCGDVSMIDIEVLYHDMDRGYACIFGPNEVSEDTKRSWPRNNHIVPYFKYAFFADSLEEALMYILYCENNAHQVPRSIEERDAIQDKIKEAVNISHESNTRIDLAHVLLNKHMNDELYDEAKKIVLDRNKASTALLQRELGIGYERGALLIESLKERGVIDADAEVIRQKMPCTCTDPLCAKCLLINCTDDACAVHPIEKKNIFREMYRNR